MKFHITMKDTGAVDVAIETAIEGLHFPEQAEDKLREACRKWFR